MQPPKQDPKRIQRQTQTPSTKNLPTGLWVIATPIGNLSDLTPRAAQALQEADWLLCEDTRRTSTLLSALGLARAKPNLERLDAHTEARSLSRWIDLLQEGQSLGLVTDAGTPGVSDPGAALVKAARLAGIPVIPMPGVSAVTAFLSACGLTGTSFTFRGFFPRKTSEQKQELEQASASQASNIYLWYESPLRIEKSLSQLALQFPELETAAAKELTKVHEKFFLGSAAEISDQVQQEIAEEGAVGEWCFAVQFPQLSTQANAQEAEAHSEWRRALQCVLSLKASVADAAEVVSQEFGISKRVVYQAGLEISGKFKNKS